MNRTGLIIALGLAAFVGVFFGLFPQLDLMISAPFQFVRRQRTIPSPCICIRRLQLARDVGLWVGTVLSFPRWPRWCSSCCCRGGSC